MKIKDIKFLPIIVALLSCGGYFMLKRNNANTTISISNDYIDTTTSSNEDIVSTTSSTEPIFTTSTETTTVTTTKIIETTVPTTVNPYSDILFLNDIDSNISLEEINNYIIKYSSYSKYSYDEAVDIIYNNLDNVNNYSSLKGYILCTLFDSANSDGLLSSTCSSSIVENRDMDLQQKEEIMLDMCDSLSLSNTDKTIVLAIFRHETGNGTSSRCVNDNNYGGIKVGESFGVYQTPEYGIYKAIMCIDGHIERNKEKLGTDDMYSIVSGMSYSYCPGTASDWTNKVISFCNTVSYDYNNFADDFEYKIS